MNFKKLAARLAVIAGLVGATIALPLASPTASANPCVGSWSIGIGGLAIPPHQDSGYMGTNHRVVYNSWDANEGLGRLNADIWHHRNVCPDDHIEVVAHSGGAAIAHAWVSANQDFPNANAVLIADPKKAAGPGGNGMSALGGFLGYPLAGTDANFGSFPVLTLCRWDDWVCNLDAPWGLSHINGSHGAYSMNAWDYDDWSSGVLMI